MWDPNHLRAQQHMKRPQQLDTLMIPLMSQTHRPLTRAKSSPASASIPSQDPSSKTITLTLPEQPEKTRFTTGNDHTAKATLCDLYVRQGITPLQPIKFMFSVFNHHFPVWV